MMVHEEICCFHGLDVKLEQLHSDESWYSVMYRLCSQGWHFFKSVFLFVSEITCHKDVRTLLHLLFGMYILNFKTQVTRLSFTLLSIIIMTMNGLWQKKKQPCDSKSTNHN